MQREECILYLEPTGRYDARTIAVMHHELDCDSGHVEELVEVMDPAGRTIAYFVAHSDARAFIDCMNSRATAT